MSVSIYIVQAVAEMALLNKLGDNVLVLPLDLDVQLYCVDNKIAYVDLSEYLDNDIHKEIVVKSQKILESISLRCHAKSLMVEVVAYLRFTLFQILLLEYLINKIPTIISIDNIYVSGWRKISKNLFSIENYIVTFVVTKLFADKVIQLDPQLEIIYPGVSDYHLLTEPKKNAVILNSPNYNFNRLVSSVISKGLKPHCVSIHSLRLLTKAKYFTMGLSEYECRIEKVKHADVGYDISFSGTTYDALLQELLSYKKDYFSTLRNRFKVIDEVLDLSKPRFVASWCTRAEHGYLLEKANEMGIKSVCISHGTVSKSFNAFDSLYKQTIADVVFTGNCTYTSLQSKIAKESLSTISVSGCPIETGNLIFSEAHPKRKKYILYAVTLKNFIGMQFYGVETYYEFLKNLDSLKKLQDKCKIPVVIKLHPSAQGSIKSLQNLYPALSFSDKKIDTLLCQAITSITFSSTVIEDSLYSHVPVILYDQWMRYQHCEAELDCSLLNKAVYYATSFEELHSAVNSVVKSKDINFAEYIYHGSSVSNYKRLLSDII